MPASINDKITEVYNGQNPTSTTVSSARSSGVTTLSCANLAGWPTDTAVHFVTYQTDVNDDVVPGTQCDWKGIVSGSTIGSLTLTNGTDNGNSVGDIVEMLPTASWAQDLVENIQAHANQDGSLISSVVRAALGVTSNVSGGWDVLNSGTAPTVSTGYNKGNKEFDLTFANVDLSSTLSPGMRLKLDRGTTPPTQCTDLESSSSQYWTRTSGSLAGITFTDDFTVEAWIKLESYTGTNQTIVSRFNGTSGWRVIIGASGNLVISGYNSGGANFSEATTYKKVPLGRWVHIAAKLDMSTFTYTSSTTQIYIDGEETPGVQTRGGTNPTTLVQAGDLQVGANNATNFFDGKIADVRVWSTLRTTTQIRDNMNQQLVGNESNLVAYFRLNGDANDSTSNANNLSAIGSATATNSDNPMKSTEYAIVTRVAYSAPNTIVTVFTGTNNNIPNMTLTNPYYSTQQKPFGFPPSLVFILQSEVVFQQGSVTTITDLLGGTITLNVPENAMLRISYRSNLQSTVAADVGGITLQEDGVDIHSTDTVLRNANNQENAFGTMFHFPTAGNHTYKLRIERRAGTGTISNPTSAPRPTILLVEVLGL